MTSEIESKRAQIQAEIIARTGIDEAMIARLVRAFYARVDEDPLLGPIFAARIVDWESHLRRMCDFWSSVALMTGRYHGQPMRAHMTLPVDARHFDRWLALFEATAREICPAAAAEHFVERARRIAESFELGIANFNGRFLPKGQRYFRADEAPAEFASPACAMHEVDPAYSGLSPTPDAAAKPSRSD